jgi:large repetitive protein
MAADRKLLAAAFAAIAFLTAGPARGAVGRPTQTGPASGAVVQFLPAFAWTPVAKADKYEFQISADAGMNSPVLGDGKDAFFTRNTRATLLKTIPNGTYWWRVRASNAAGESSAWTQPRSFRKLWNLVPALQSPTSGSALSFPANPVVLKWSGVPGAAHYLVSAASDPSLGSLVLHYANQDDPKGAPNVAATSAAITAALAPGSYYWGVTPVDAEGNRGVATPVASFTWLWPSTTAVHLEDLNPAPEAYDPRFSWSPVPGAARYEVEINS